MQERHGTLSKSVPFPCSLHAIHIVSFLLLVPAFPSPSCLRRCSQLSTFITILSIKALPNSLSTIHSAVLFLSIPSSFRSINTTCKLNHAMEYLNRESHCPTAPLLCTVAIAVTLVRAGRQLDPSVNTSTVQLKLFFQVTTTTAAATRMVSRDWSCDLLQSMQWLTLEQFLKTEYPPSRWMDIIQLCWMDSPSSKNTLPTRWNTWGQLDCSSDHPCGQSPGLSYWPSRGKHPLLKLKAFQCLASILFLYVIWSSTLL